MPCRIRHPPRIARDSDQCRHRPGCRTHRGCICVAVDAREDVSRAMRLEDRPNRGRPGAFAVTRTSGPTPLTTLAHASSATGGRHRRVTGQPSPRTAWSLVQYWSAICLPGRAGRRRRDPAALADDSPVMDEPHRWQVLELIVLRHDRSASSYPPATVTRHLRREAGVGRSSSRGE